MPKIINTTTNVIQCNFFNFLNFFLFSRTEKEETLKRVHIFNSIVKDSREENSKIKAPTRDYTESDLTINKYKNEKENLTLQKPTFINKHPDKQTNFVDLDKDTDVNFLFF